jgi:hypothetical protein
MSKRRHTDEQIDDISRVQSAIWFSLLEALGPEVAARAVQNLRDFGVLYSEDPRCERLCNDADPLIG